ncbi:hypothetical protein HY479_02790 [Candidatus Uhrbacteria bacterium]|nr:hypothetical protein [Candidatus Uhrbacteria bacterium]
MTTQSITLATEGQQKQIVRLVEEVASGVLKELELTKEDAQRLLGKGGDLKKELAGALGPMVQRFSMAAETVTVPDLPAAELIALAKAEFKKAGIPFTHFDEDLAAWDFLEGERGKTFEVLVHNFGRVWETEEGRSYQKGNRFDGNVAAFIAWVTRKKPNGWFISIPNDDSRLWRNPGRDGYLCAPDFGRDDANREFRLLNVRSGGSGSLVAFRAV